VNGRCLTTCPRCHGSGFLPRFGHIHKGLCFKCEGAGTVFRTLLGARRRVIGMHANGRRDVPRELALTVGTHRESQPARSVAPTLTASATVAGAFTTLEGR
jgi:hypothetical protein